MKQKILKIVNPLLALAFFFSAGGGITRLIAPDLIPDEKFSAMHPIFGVTLATCIAIHLVLNWNWVKNAFFRKKSAEASK